MREIKFRAWDGEKLSEVVAWTSDDALCLRDFSEFGTRMVQREKCSPLMQFTGLKDKNGQEIYEGDIVQFTPNFGRGDPRRAFVDYRQDDARYWLYFKLDRTSCTGTCNLYHGSQPAAVVIGNICEHPHLLDEQTALPL